MKHFFQTYWPVIILLCVEILIVATNYTSGTYLMGWDNVMPEFNFKQAFITNILGAWQYHRGLGLADGMGHAANLVHTLFLWMLSFVLPQNALRYFFHLLMHLVGMIGVYALTASLPGALFYGLNLITIQMFYTPLEAFSVHYAALPWLTYSLLRYLRQPSHTTLFLFVIVSILSTPQFFIPTLLLPTTMLLTALSCTNLKLSIKPALYFLMINAFWLMPYLVNLPINAPVIQNAKINQMSSGEVYARNQVFGDLKNVLTMKGFMLDFEDVDTDGQPIFVMAAWRAWLANPGIQIIGYMIAGVIILRLWKFSWAGAIWLLSGLFLANNTPYISSVIHTLRDQFPTFAEAYRFPFTKFSLLFAFSASLLATQFFSFVRGRLAKLIFAALILGISFPIFTGHFFYDALRVNLPKDYIALFAFMDKQDHNGRIANLPQPSYWSWKHYNWGYVGSGFLWYGLSQPLMDRAFDPWSQYNEQYYQELSHALYSNDASALNAVLSKYDIRYIIYDNALVSPGNNRALIPEETKTILSQYTSIAHFGQLSVYERTSTQTLMYSLPVVADGPKTEVFHSLPSPESYRSCGILKRGDVSATMINGILRMSATNQRGCLSFGIPSLSHRDAYQITVSSRHLSGRPVLFSLINNTTKHIETEQYLTGNDTYFLPPLSPDGLGYTIYVTNEGFGDIETVNDILDIRISAVPYNIPNSTIDNSAITLSQAYHPYWLAFDLTTGKFLPNHRVVNTWENGWDKPSNEVTNNEHTVLFLFWPQLLEFGGLAILACGLLILAIKK